MLGTPSGKRCWRVNRRRWARTLCAALCALLWLGQTAQAVTYATLRPGAAGPAVLSAQRALNSLGYPLAADGKYGLATMQAVREFQAAQRLTADGLAGNQTLTVLYRLAPGFAPGGEAPAATPAPQQGERYELGSFGSGVARMQARLQALGYACERADGVFDVTTRAAVIAFQHANRLTADGIAGSMTLSRLYSDSAAAAPAQPTQTPVQTPAATPAPTPDMAAPAYGRLEMGSAGEQVTRLQVQLRALGFLTGAADGKFGLQTRAAVTAFQRAHGLKADGIAGTQTLALLFGGAPTATPAAQPTATPPASEPGTAGWAQVYTQNGGSLNFRSSPETRSNNVIANLAVGTRVEVLGSQEQWSAIRVNGRQGYVMTRFLKPVDEPAPTATPTQTPEPEATAEPTASPSPSPYPRVLRGGETGEDVTSLQRALKALGYDAPATGAYDEQTRAAVQRFQSLNGLTADGRFGAQSAQVLLSGAARPADAAPLTFRTLRIDNKDAADTAIASMQLRLKELGFRVSVNGTFDVLTHEAVVAFQRRNGLTVSGIADLLTQTRLHAGTASGASAPVDDPPADAGKGGGPSSGSVKLLHWFNQVKPAISSGQSATVHDPGSGISFRIRFYSLGHHADSEPMTLTDTLLMNRAFGLPSWNIHPVYVKLPSGAWVMATMHNRPHLSGAIQSNGFGGHLCVHFLRDLEECQRNDPNYGMSNQRVLRSAWKALTGEVVE